MTGKTARLWSAVAAVLLSALIMPTPITRADPNLDAAGFWDPRAPEDPVLHPGSEVFNYSDTGDHWSSCTLGVWASDPAGVPGFITAGHCRREDSTSIVYRPGPPAPDTEIGNFGLWTGADDPGDAAFVPVRPGVEGDTAIGGTVPDRVATPEEIAGFGAAGGQFCKFGARTGLSCGPLTVIGEHYFAFRAWDEPGDSGAPVFFRGPMGEMIIAGILHSHDDDEQGRVIIAALLAPAMNAWGLRMLR